MVTPSSLAVVERRGLKTGDVRMHQIYQRLHPWVFVEVKDLNKENSFSTQQNNLVAPGMVVVNVGVLKSCLRVLEYDRKCYVKRCFKML